MRLLQLGDDAQSFSLVQYLDCDIPPYAILSHTWGDEEVIYQDLIGGVGVAKQGYKKLTFCASRAAMDGLRHFWVDTCCINKESSAELSEAITSMFRWYRNSVKCYVYLSDVHVKSTEPDHRMNLAFRTSRWFSRGWTLQELIAPPDVLFFSADRELIGDKKSMEQQIQDVTRLPRAVIRGAALADFDVEDRISWITNRQTKREEDMAYSLLGILEVNMLPNYGEGKKPAFRRLRRELKAAQKDSEDSVLTKRREILLRALRFGLIDARQMSIKVAHSETCTWLLRNTEYLRWLNKDEVNDHHGFLWIRGKPGTGKSTLMKFALDHACSTSTEKVVVSYFFNARGESLEKSTVGTYRSLLFQLLDRFPTLHSAFDCLDLPKSDVEVNLEWKVEMLKQLLERAILLLRHYAVVCYIDALDECKDEQVRDMVQFFEYIGERVLLSNIDFRVCFSSRHYPHITIRHAVNLVLEGQQGHSQDITHYLNSNLNIGRSIIASKIRKEIQAKAQGVFMWVVLVVKILNKEYDRGRIHVLQRKLQEIPEDLHDLFRDLLLRESQDQDELILCIQWVLFAERPLTPVELYFAVLSAVDPDALSVWDGEEVDYDVIERFILDSSRGLTEVTPVGRVQFIHESVRDFLLKGDGLGAVWPDLQLNFAGRSHDRLKQCCYDYIIIMDSTEPCALGSDASRSHRTSYSNAISKQSPFMRYAMDGVLFHADAAEKNHTTQLEFLQSFSIGQWVRLNNRLNVFGEYTEHVSLVYVLADRGLVSLLRVHAPTSLGLETAEELYGCPIFAAAAKSNLTAVHEFFGRYRRHGISYDRRFMLAYGEALSESLGTHFRYSRGRGLLSYAAQYGIAPVLAYLLKNVASAALDTGDEEGRTPLWWASSKGHFEIVEQLCDTNSVDINTPNQTHGTPLYAAASNGHPSIVRMLLDRGAEVNVKGGKYGSALLSVCATEPHNTEVCQLLLDTHGVDVNIYVKNRMTPLLWASCKAQFNFMTLLLEKAADIDWQDTSGCTPLIKALEACNENVRHVRQGSLEDIAKLLIAIGANVNLQGGLYGNALQAAALIPQLDLVKLLVKAGADVNMPGGKFGTALQAASTRYASDPTGKSSNVHIVEFLLQEGANPNIKGGMHCTALQAAVYSGSKTVLKLLIDHGADVNAQVGINGTALQAASVEGDEEAARILIDHGADVNARGGKHGNALNAALWHTLRGDKKDSIVDLLRRHGAVEQGSRKRPRAAT